jgi:hypothetical protein
MIRAFMILAPVATSSLQAQAPSPRGIHSTHHLIGLNILALAQVLHDVRPDTCSESDSRSAKDEGDCWCATEENGGGKDTAHRSTDDRVVVGCDLADVVPLRIVN